LLLLLKKMWLRFHYNYKEIK